MFNTMINGDSEFAEKKERKVMIPFSHEAVDMMVQFMYGIEFEYEDPDYRDDLEVLLELIEIGGVYGIENLDKAAAERIKSLVNPTNVFHILSFSHLHNADDLKKICENEIINNLSEEDVLQEKVIMDCPELGVELWKLFHEKKKAPPKTSSDSPQKSVQSQKAPKRKILPEIRVKII